MKEAQKMMKGRMVLLTLASVFLISLLYGSVSEGQLPIVDVALTTDVSDEAPSVGDEITYYIEVSNLLPFDATGIEITDKLPSGVTYLDHSAGEGIYNPSTGVWTLGNLGSIESTFLGSIGNTFLHIAVKVDEGTVGTTVTNTAEVTAMDQDDANPDNDSYTIAIAIQSHLGARIDIEPGCNPSFIDLSSNGVIPVAILTTENFNANSVDGGTVTFGPDHAQPIHSDAYFEDVNGDGNLDWIGRFRTQETGIEAGDTEATLTGKALDGSNFQGTDSIVTVGKSKKPRAATTLWAVGKIAITWDMIKAKY
jgi:uncharacterized repeat protein (TIGR01451 family)